VGGGVAKPSRRDELRAHMLQLNKSFLSWVNKQVEVDAPKLLSNGLRDYLSHAGKLEEEFKDVVSATEPAVPAPSGAPQFSFGHTFTGATEKIPKKDPSPISAEKKAKAKLAAAAAAEESNGETVFESKSKAFRRNKDEWRDLGIGSLSVVKPESGKSFICFRNISTGKVFLRAGLYENIKVTVQKKAATLVLFPAKEDAPPLPDHLASPGKKEEDLEGKPVTFSFRFGKLETVNKFKSACEASA